MAHGFAAAGIAQLNAERNAPAHLFEVYLDSGTIYATDSYRSIAYAGNTYTALGHFLGYEGVEETADLQVPEARVTLSGCDAAQTWIAAVLQEEYIDRRLVIRKIFLTDAGAVVDTGVLHDGRMDGPVISDDPAATSAVSIVSSSHFADFERRAGRRTNHQDSQLYFPGERGFEYASELTTQVLWGRRA